MLNKRNAKIQNSIWKKVLLLIYNIAPHQYGDGLKLTFYDSKHPLAKELKLNGTELGTAVSFLSEYGLVDRTQMSTDSGANSWLKLTSKGFETAFELEKVIEQHQFTKVAAYATTISAIIALISFMSTLIKFEGSFTLTEKILVALIIILCAILGNCIYELIQGLLKNKQ